ncbi:MAG: hypothetical protein JNK14_10205 [Chitinophagaceae bacterium]|nr:hypothetical protein [Chitinophagaceae bacterium]
MNETATPHSCTNTNSDADGNQIGKRGKRIAGVLLIFFTAFMSTGIIAYWPDKLPGPKDNIAPIYKHRLFRICLVGLPDSLCCPDSITQKIAIADTTWQTVTRAIDSVGNPIKDTASGTIRGFTRTQTQKAKLIHLNTLLLLLVAMGGFLGNMIHVATSFTTFVGAGKFKRSWILWYCVKPFTAGALAMGLYFVFRAGFLNMSDGGGSINLYGLMTLSILTGLFTDKATEKLKEIFEVIFKAKDVRPDALVDAFKIMGIAPMQIEKGKENKLTLTGENLDKQKWAIFINDEPVTNLVVTKASIAFTYTITEKQKDKTVFIVSVKDEKGKEQFKAELPLKNGGAAGDTPAQGPAGDNDNNNDEPAVG